MRAEQGGVLRACAGVRGGHLVGAPGAAAAGRGQGERRAQERAQQPQRDLHRAHSTAQCVQTRKIFKIFSKIFDPYKTLNLALSLLYIQEVQNV